MEILYIAWYYKASVPPLYFKLIAHLGPNKWDIKKAQFLQMTIGYHIAGVKGLKHDMFLISDYLNRYVEGEK